MAGRRLVLHLACAALPGAVATHQDSRPAGIPVVRTAGLAVDGRYDLFQSTSEVPNARFHTERKRGNQEWATAL